MLDICVCMHVCMYAYICRVRIWVKGGCWGNGECDERCTIRRGTHWARTEVDRMV